MERNNFASLKLIIVQIIEVAKTKKLNLKNVTLFWKFFGL